jgi:flavodoxin
MKCLIVLVSVHHRNTQKIAAAMADALGAEVRTPGDVDPGELRKYDLVGFGSGIYSDRHHTLLLELAERIPRTEKGKAFLFSTFGVPAAMANKEFLREYSEKTHSALGNILVSKGFQVDGNFSCVGWNTNSFLKWFGGINKGRPNAADLENAREFARELARETVK